MQYTHDNELRDLKLRLEVEKEQWQATVKQKQVHVYYVMFETFNWANLSEFVRLDELFSF